MQYLEIILNLPVNQGFTYSYIPPEKEKPELKPVSGLKLCLVTERLRALS